MTLELYCMVGIELAVIACVIGAVWYLSGGRRKVPKIKHYHPSRNHYDDTH